MDFSVEHISFSHDIVKLTRRRKRNMFNRKRREKRTVI